MVGYFRDIRAHAGYLETPISMPVIEGWQRHAGVALERWERECIFAMDRAARSAHADVVKYHSDRDEALSKHKAEHRKGR